MSNYNCPLFLEVLHLILQPGVVLFLQFLEQDVGLLALFLVGRCRICLDEVRRGLVKVFEEGSLHVGSGARWCQESYKPHFTNKLFIPAQLVRQDPARSKITNEAELTL